MAQFDAAVFGSLSARTALKPFVLGISPPFENEKPIAERRSLLHERGLGIFFRSYKRMFMRRIGIICLANW